MTEKPIYLNSSYMIRAILDGRKTETRLIVSRKPNLVRYCPVVVGKRKHGWEDDHGRSVTLPCSPGDLLWIKEPFFVEITGDFPYAGEGLKLSEWTPELIKETIVHYRATTELNNPDDWYWESPVDMPKWASRIALRVLSVHPEPLWSIMWGRDDLAEGVEGRAQYIQLWDKVHGKGSFDANPWVWVIKFEVE